MLPFFLLSRFQRPHSQQEVIHHWYAFAEEFSTSTTQFYAALQAELEARHVPGLQISTLDWNEGGLLSDRRTYLRFTRERLAFDICAAPFGVGYFFSCRTVVIPAPIHPLSVLTLLFGIWFILQLFVRALGIINGFFFFGVSFVTVLCLMRYSVSLGLSDLDAYLIKTPILGPLYERFLRKETYYREDTRLIYKSMIPDLVKAEAHKVTAAFGIKLLKEYEYSPGSYQMSLVAIEDVVVS